MEEWETGKMSEQPKALNFQLNKTSNISQLEFCILYSLRKVIFASFCWQNQESVLQAHQAQCIPSNSIMFHRTCLYLKSKLNPVESTCQQYLYVSSALAGPCQGSHAKAQALISSGPRLLREFSSTFVAHTIQTQHEHSVEGSEEEMVSFE